MNYKGLVSKLVNMSTDDIVRMHNLYCRKYDELCRTVRTMQDIVGVCTYLSVDLALSDTDTRFCLSDTDVLRALYPPENIGRFDPDDLYYAYDPATGYCLSFSDIGDTGCVIDIGELADYILEYRDGLGNIEINDYIFMSA